MKRKSKKLITLLACLTLTFGTFGSLSACDIVELDGLFGGTETPTELTFSVTFDTTGGSRIVKQTVKVNEKATKPTDPVRDGYTFLEWRTTNGETYDFNTPITYDLKLVAVWAKKHEKTFTVTFDVGEGTPIEAKKVRDGGCILEPNTTRAGYYIDEWTLNGEPYDYATPITSDITLKAEWKAGTMSASLQSGYDVMTEGETGKIQVATDIPAPINFVSSNENVLTVEEDGTVVTKSSGYAEVTVKIKTLKQVLKFAILPKGEAIQAVDTYMVKAGVMNNKTFRAETKNGVTTIWSKYEGYDNKTGVVWSFPYEKEYFELLGERGYELSFNISVSGVDFAEWNAIWSYGSMLGSKSEFKDENGNLLAVSDCTRVKAGAGIVTIPMNTITNRYERAIDLGSSKDTYATSADMYNFFLSSSYSTTKMRDVVITITGSAFRKPTEYTTNTVTYDVSGGTSVASATTITGTPSAQVNEPLKDGYAFAGWMLDDEPYDLTTPVTQDITLKANWKVPTFTIGFANDNDSVIDGIGETTTLKVSSTEKATWSSVNPTIASVDEKGVVTGVSVGSTRIKATVNGETTTVLVHVADDPNFIVEATTFFYAGQYVQTAWGGDYGALIRPTKTDEFIVRYNLSNKSNMINHNSITWRPNESVTPKEYYVALKNAGYGFKLQVSVTANETGVEIDKNALVFGQAVTSAKEKQTVYVNLDAFINNWDALQSTSTGTPPGTLSGANGRERFIFYTDGYKGATLDIYEFSLVKFPKVDVTLSTTSKQVLAPTETAQFELDTDLTGEVQWSSSNEKVATVDQTGKVTGVSAGEAYITASVDGLRGTCATPIWVTGAVDLTNKAELFYVMNKAGNRPATNWNASEWCTVTQTSEYVSFNLTAPAGSWNWYNDAVVWVPTASKAYFQYMKEQGYTLKMEFAIYGNENVAYKGNVCVFGQDITTAFGTKTTMTGIEDKLLNHWDALQANTSEINRNSAIFPATLFYYNNYEKGLELRVYSFEFVKA